ncbi:MAG: hypothetical protein KAG66_10865 [Methylococcales bacterium]|nr:hypothetical protein [Methylococcales bacterium]
MTPEHTADLAKHVDAAKQEAEAVVQSLQGPAMNAIINYIDVLVYYEMARCSSLDEDMHLRRSQGSMAAYAVVSELLKHTSVDKRRTASRREV